RYSDMTVVGVYRSHTRGPQGLSGEDLELYQTCFSESHDLFLVVHPVPGGPAFAAISYREGGAVRTFPGQFPIAAGTLPAVSPPPLDPVSFPEKTRRLPGRWM